MIIKNVWSEFLETNWMNVEHMYKLDSTGMDSHT